MKTKRFILYLIPIVLVPVLLLSTCNFSADPAGQDVRTIQILATSDLHNYFLPWDYEARMPYAVGSLAQAAAAVRERRNENTILLDCGDSFQGNGRGIFPGDSPEPMAAGMNAMEYDVFIAGDHEFDYGPNRFRELAASLDAVTLCGNVFDRDNVPLADAYTIIERNGLKIGIIGLVTSAVNYTDTFNVFECAAADPSVTARQIIDEIRGRCDLLIAAVHMGDQPENGFTGTSVGELAEACPELDLIISSHLHGQPEDAGAPLPYAGTLSVITLTAERTRSGWTIANTERETVELSDYEPDAALVELLAPYDALGREAAP